MFGCPITWAPAATGCAKVERQIWRAPRKRVDTSQPVKNFYDKERPNWGISVVTLIRTDTTLDHSQKAEKVYQPPLYPDSFTKRGSTTKRNPTGGFSRDILATVA